MMALKSTVKELQGDLQDYQRVSLINDEDNKRQIKELLLRTDEKINRIHKKMSQVETKLEDAIRESDDDEDRVSYYSGAEKTSDGAKDS